MRVSIIICCLFLIAAIAVAQTNDPALLFEQARHKQLVEGDLETAIHLYQKIVTQYASNRPVAAKALVQIGRAYEKLGKEQARQSYERVLREYADQVAEANEARDRLASLQRPATKEFVGLATRRVWHGPEANSLGAPSPDGRYLTATDWNTGNLVLRDLASGQSRPLTNKVAWDAPEFAMFSRPSPDGKHVAYAWGSTTYELRVTRVDGSSTRVLTTSGYLQPMAWTPDGKGILTLVWKESRGVDAVIVSASDLSIRTVKAFERRRVPTRFSFSPDGKFLVYDLGKADPLQRDIFVLTVGSGEDHLLVESPANDSSPLWTPDGRQVLFVSDRGGTPSLWAVPVGDGKALGDPKLIKPDMGRILPIAFTREGTLFYALEVGENDIYEASLDSESGLISGRPGRVTNRYVGSNSYPVWAPDGSSLCYISRRGLTISGDTNQNAVLVIRGPDGKEREIEPMALARFSRPVWTPDGKTVLVIGRPRSGDANNGVYAIDIASGDVRPLLIETDSWVNGIALSPDGKTLYFGRQVNKDKAFDLVRRDLATGEEKVLHRPSDGGGLGVTLAISPDGGLLATRVWWMTGEALNAVRIIPTTPGEAPRDPLGLEKANPAGALGALVFSGDGKHLIFARRRPQSDGARELWRVPVEGGKPTPLGLEIEHLRELSMSPDGRRILFTAGESSQEIWVMENLFARSDKKQVVRR